LEENHIEHITDPVFGTLEVEDWGWTGHVYLAAFNETLNMEIFGTEQTREPQEPERKAFTAFLEHQHELKIGLEHAILDYYTHNLELHRSRFDTDAKTRVPDLHHPNEIWSQVSLGHIVLSVRMDGRVEISLTFGANWDEEHGLDVTFFDDKMGVAEGSADWTDKTHYDLKGRRLA
jgi:hypothetical protein